MVETQSAEQHGAAPATSGLRSTQDHHDRLWRELEERAGEVVNTSGRGQGDAEALRRLVEFARGDMLAHLETERRVLYRAARDLGAGWLADSLESGHAAMLAVIAELDHTMTAADIVRDTYTLTALLSQRIQQEETQLMPLLQQAGVDVDSLLDTMVMQMSVDFDARFTYL